MDFSILEQEFKSYFSTLFPVGFARSEVRQTTFDYIVGLYLTTERKNCWTIAEAMGYSNPQPFQRLLRCARADFEALQARYWELAARNFPVDGSIGILDETGFEKSGTKSVGVQRQYSGTMGKVDNCQVAVYLAASTDKGHLILDRRLYLPHDWITETAWRKEAKIPDNISFKTKGQLAIELLTAQYARGVTFSWMAGDEVYGDSDELRAYLIKQDQRFVLAASKDTKAWTGRPTLKRRLTKRGLTKPEIWKRGPKARSLEEIAAAFLPHKWRRIMCEGSQGQRIFDWAAKRIILGRRGEALENLWLLVRRGLDGRMDYYLCHAPSKISLQELVRVANERWRIETSFREAKDLVGLDQYQVRQWQAWHRHTMLAQVAHLMLACIQQKQAQILAPLKITGLIMTRSDVRRLLARLLQPPPATLFHFSTWFVWRIQQRLRASLSHARAQARIHGFSLAS